MWRSKNNSLEVDGWTDSKLIVNKLYFLLSLQRQIVLHEQLSCRMSSLVFEISGPTVVHHLKMNHFYLMLN